MESDQVICTLRLGKLLRLLWTAPTVFFVPTALGDISPLQMHIDEHALQTAAATLRLSTDKDQIDQTDGRAQTEFMSFLILE